MKNSMKKRVKRTYWIEEDLEKKLKEFALKNYGTFNSLSDALNHILRSFFNELEDMG